MCMQLQVPVAARYYQTCILMWEEKGVALTEFYHTFNCAKCHWCLITLLKGTMQILKQAIASSFIAFLTGDTLCLLSSNVWYSPTIITILKDSDSCV